ncbi:hypothetical protein GO755_27040 [Spirosoma sp. HMF4905]|uniref:Uncharacterized protein n=1 Tax=Spirosoma arboris TaxID=2682092 RepID=A0A7K1SIX4_9BACT|nr:hypothetical protein [Spirosoma arboris]MVM33723.1 hypothetical protein [Spirosoma arboris]
MKSLSGKLKNAEKLQSADHRPLFSAYIDDRWETINESEFFNALYTGLFIKDEDDSMKGRDIYKRKRD